MLPTIVKEESRGESSDRCFRVPAERRRWRVGLGRESVKAKWKWKWRGKRG